MSAPADASVRATALDPRQSFIVQAPAGSGKTELLTRRVLILLAVVDEPEEILAITFTRKAASEMRQRVIEVLVRAGSGEPARSDHQQQALDLAQAVLARDQQRCWNLIDTPSRLSIRTIDSLCASLTRQLPVTTGFGSPLSVTETPKSLYRLAARRCLAHALDDADWRESARVLLRHLDNNALRTQLLIAEMLAQRDQWLRHIGKVADRSARESDFAALVTSHLHYLLALLPEPLTGTLPPLMRHAGQMSEVLKPASALKRLRDATRLPAPVAEELDEWRAVADLLLTVGGSIRKKLDRNGGFPVSRKDAELVGLPVETLTDRKAQFQQLLQQVGDDPVLVSALADIRTLPDPVFTDEQWLVISALLNLLPLAVGELHLTFAERGEVDYAEISMRASQALGEPDAPSELALAMDYRIRHILVDEFQDTSLSQFNLFQQLTAGWEADDGRTFFAVGDPMQSIYRFRDAEVGLFGRAQQQGIGDVALKPLQLTVNFRSDRRIVDWCNDTFGSLFPSKAQALTGAVSYAQSVPFVADKPGSEVVVTPWIDESPQQQADELANQVRQAVDELPDELSQVAILVRSRTVMKEVFPALQQLGVRYQALEMETLGDRLVCRDIITLCRALQQPQDRLHWVALLRSPLCGLTLSDLTMLVAAQRYASVWNLMTDATVLDGLSADGRRRIDELVGLLGPARDRVGREALVPWVERCWIRAGGQFVYQSPVDLLAAEMCLQELSRIEQAGQLEDRGWVDERMQALYAPADTDPACRVQIMSMHKSKGLQFDTVFLPALGRRPRGDSTSLIDWLEMPDITDGGLLVAPLPEANTGTGDRESKLVCIKHFNKRKTLNEQTRLLYVAATRAERRLYLSGQGVVDRHGELGKPAEGTLLGSLWPVVQPVFEQRRQTGVAQAAEVVVPDASVHTTSAKTITFDGTTNDAANGVVDHEIRDAANVPAMLARLRADWQPPDWASNWVVAATATSGMAPESATADEPALEFLWAGLSARAIGTVVHRQLQRIAEEGLTRWPPERLGEPDQAALPGDVAQLYRRLLKAEGVADRELDAAIGRVADILRQALSDDRFRWLTDASHSEAESELAVSGVINGEVCTGVIDRTFVDREGTRWVVDYKTGQHRGGSLPLFLSNEVERYRPQLERYAALMWALESREVRLALYFPLYRHWYSWKPDEP